MNTDAFKDSNTNDTNSFYHVEIYSVKRLKFILQLEPVCLGAATFFYRIALHKDITPSPHASAILFSWAAASCPLQAIQEQATLEDSPHVGQTHRRVHVLALQPLPTARARSAVTE